MESDYYNDIPLTSRRGDTSDVADRATSPEGHAWDYVEPDDGERTMAERAKAYEEAFSEMQGQQIFDDDTPQRIREYLLQRRRYIPRAHVENSTQGKAFYEDALFLSDVTDSAPIVPYSDFAPNFRTMSRSQLRSYCTFRTNFRKGVHLDVPPSYLHLLCNELVMRIGTKDAEEAFQLLSELLHTYADHCRYRLLSYRCTTWLKDFVIVWALKEHYDEVFADVVKEHEKSIALLAPDEYCDHAVAIALQHNSCYQFLDSSYGTRNGDEMEQTAARMIRHFDRILRDAANTSFYQRYIDHRETLSRSLFVGLYYWQEMPGHPRNTSVEIDSMLRFICLDGHWMQDGYLQGSGNARKNEIGDITHELERQVRSLHNNRRMKQRDICTEAQQAISLAIADYKQSLDEACRPKIEVDLSKLASIRHNATLVRDALLTEEERPDTKEAATWTAHSSPAPLSAAKAADATPAPTTPAHSSPAGTLPSSSTPLSQQEATYLSLLIAGKDTAPFLKECHIMESIITESINDKLYDVIGDIVLEDGDYGTRIVEDYRPFLLQLLP